MACVGGAGHPGGPVEAQAVAVGRVSLQSRPRLFLLADAAQRLGARAEPGCSPRALVVRVEAVGAEDRPVLCIVRQVEVVDSLLATAAEPEGGTGTACRAGLLATDLANLALPPSGGCVRLLPAGPVAHPAPTVWSSVYLQPAEPCRTGERLCPAPVAAAQLRGVRLCVGHRVLLVDIAQGHREYLCVGGRGTVALDNVEHGLVAASTAVVVEQRDTDKHDHAATTAATTASNPGALLPPSYSKGFRALLGLLRVGVDTAPMPFARPSLILVCGSEGSGVAHILQHFCSALGLFLLDWHPGLEAASTISQALGRAQDHAPAVVFVDSIDVYYPHQPDLDDDDEDFDQALACHRLVKGLAKHDGVMVVATASSKGAVHPQLRNAITDVVTVPCLDEADLAGLLTAVFGPELEEPVAAARLCQGFSRADVLALCSAARSEAARASRAVALQDFRKLVADARGTTNAEDGWSGVHGYTGVKALLEEVVVWPYTRRRECEELGIPPPRGILLFGVSGVGKSMLARGLAARAQLPSVLVTPKHILRSEVGESERLLRNLFARAKAAGPVLLIFDQVQSLFGHRSSDDANEITRMLVPQLALEMDSLAPDVTVVFVTNRPQALDEALLRPGRIDELVHVPVPDKDTRRAVLASIRAGWPPQAWDVDTDWLAEATDGMTGADLMALAQDAAMAAVQAQTVPTNHTTKAADVRVTAGHFEAALQECRLQLDPAQAQAMEAWANSTTSAH